MKYTVHGVAKSLIQLSDFHFHDTDFPVAQTVKNLPAVQKTGICSLGWEIPLEKGMAIHSSILAWRIPWRSLAGYSPWGHKEWDKTN